MSREQGPEPALAQGGPLDGTALGGGRADKYSVEMEDHTRHVYVRSERRTDGGRLYDYAGRE